MTGTAAATLPAVSPEHFKSINDVFALVASRGGDAEELARVAGVPVAVVHGAMNDPDTAVRLQDAQTAAEGNGSLLKDTANRVALAMLQKVRDELAAGTLDADDIGNLLPKVHKVVEHAERMEQARGNGNEGLATIQFILINGAVTARVSSPAAEVVDIDASEVRDE
jgi:hypothetical protein